MLITDLVTPMALMLRELQDGPSVTYVVPDEFVGVVYWALAYAGIDIWGWMWHGDQYILVISKNDVERADSIVWAYCGMELEEVDIDEQKNIFQGDGLGTGTDWDV